MTLTHWNGWQTLPSMDSTRQSHYLDLLTLSPSVSRYHALWTSRTFFYVTALLECLNKCETVSLHILSTICIVWCSWLNFSLNESGHHVTIYQRCDILSKVYYTVAYHSVWMVHISPIWNWYGRYIGMPHVSCVGMLSTARYISYRQLVGIPVRTSKTNHDLEYWVLVNYNFMHR